jgi:hypothetical protein
MTEIRPASRELIALATAARGEEWANDLDGALAAAHTNGWDWPRAGAYASQLIFNPQGSPRDLLAAAAKPTAPPKVLPPDVGASGAALARELLAQRRTEPGDAEAGAA